MTPSVANEFGHRVAIVFDYRSEDTFEDVSRAMQSLTEAFRVYARSKTASLRIESFSGGSLECRLLANEAAWVGAKILANDLTDLQAGQKSALMPEAERRNLRTVLNHVAQVRLNIEDRDYVLDSRVSALLEQKPKDDSKRDTVHSGILDRVDLRDNSFRIMLPHGQRVGCHPALPFVDRIRESLAFDVPRLQVVGDGRYGRSDFLPGSIMVRSVNVITKRPKFSDLVAEVSSGVDKDELRKALVESEERVGEHFRAYVETED